jgi:hypothetical protein
MIRIAKPFKMIFRSEDIAEIFSFNSNIPDMFQGQ